MTFTNVAVACDCGNFLIDLPIKEMGWTQTETTGISSISDIIFTGVLLDLRKVEETYQSSLSYETKEIKYELIFKLIKSYKGDKNDTIKIRTNNRRATPWRPTPMRKRACVEKQGERESTVREVEGKV